MVKSCYKAFRALAVVSYFDKNGSDINLNIRNQSTVGSDQICHNMLKFELQTCILNTLVIYRGYPDNY